MRATLVSECRPHLSQDGKHNMQILLRSQLQLRDQGQAIRRAWVPIRKKGKYE